jgi:succinate dehydrogenase (ubiquinone) iron-sulfur subunit
LGWRKGARLLLRRGSLTKWSRVRRVGWSGSIQIVRFCYSQLGLSRRSTMNINGDNGLACLTKISGASSASTVSPLPHMFVVKDLVVDMTNFYSQYKSVEPWLKRKDQPLQQGKEIPQTKADRAKLDGMYECILCACCSTSCSSYWWNPEEYLGPIALLHANRYTTFTATLHPLYCDG